MARYRILHWRDIPSLVEVFDGHRRVDRALSQRFQDLIDAAAMRAGATGTEAYLEGWDVSREMERPGTPEAVAEAVSAEIEAGFEEVLARHLRGPG
jgi:hypothetical protein